MAYEPTNWQCGDVVTAEALNRIEQGIADSGGKGRFVVTFDQIDDGQGNITYTSDKTFAEIIQAIEDGYDVIGQTVYTSMTDYFYLDRYSYDSESGYASFIQLDTDSHILWIHKYDVAYDDSVGHTAVKASVTPIS